MKNLLIYIFLSFFVSDHLQAQIADSNGDDLSSLIMDIDHVDPMDDIELETVEEVTEDIEWPSCANPRNLKLKKSNTTLYVEWEDKEIQDFEYEVKFSSEDDIIESESKIVSSRFYELPLNTIKEYSKISVRRICEIQNNTSIYSGWTHVDIEIASSLLAPATICDILSFLTITVMSDGTFFISMPNSNDPNNQGAYLEMLDELGLTHEQYQDMITNDWPSQMTTGITFYDSHGESFSMSYELTSTSTNSGSSTGPTIIELLNQGDYISISPALANYSGGYTSGYLATLATFTFSWIDDNGDTQECDITPTIIGGDDGDDDDDDDTDLTSVTLECGVELDDTPVSTELNTEVITNNQYMINHFPFYIVSITSNVNGVINGVGKLVLPFSNLEVFVNLNAIKINTENQVFAGSVTGIDGQSIHTFPSYNLPPIFIGGEICVPPPNIEVPDKDGFGPDGLNGYGFGVDGIHPLTGTELDPFGYDIAGNHKDTGKPYNEDGCDRDGFLWEGDPMVKTDKHCDHTGGTAGPQAVTDFVNAGNLDPNGRLLKVREVFDDLKAIIDGEHTVKAGLCETIRGALETATDGFTKCATSVNGKDNSLIETGMSKNFQHPPSILQINGVVREATAELVEEKHVELYNCDVELTALKLRVDIYGEIALDPDLVLLEQYVREKLDAISQAELDLIIASTDSYYNWVKAQILKYIEITFPEVVVFQQDVLEENTYLDNGYSAVASDGMIAAPVDRLEQIQFQYDQGFGLINGIPRPYYVEELKKRQEAHALATGLVDINAYQPLRFSHLQSNWDFSFYLDKIAITPTEATFSVALMMTNTTGHEKIAVGAENLVFHANGDVEGQLNLFNEVRIRLMNSARLILDANGTSIAFDCNGFKSINLKSRIEFCREHVTPLVPDASNTLIPDPDLEKLYELEIPQQVFTGWLDYYLDITADPFSLTKVDGYIFEIGLMTLDMSSAQSPTGVENVPPLYESPYFSNGSFDKLWKGFYVKDFNITFPNFITTENDDQLQVAVKSLIFDGNGGSSLVELNDPNNPVLEAGKAGGWEFSIHGVNIAVVHNNIVGGGFTGTVGVPILKNPMDYSATMLPGNGIILSVFPAVENEMPLFKANAVLKKTTFLKGEYTFDPVENLQKFKLNASLDGHINILPDVDIKNVKLPEIKFEGVKFANHGDNKFSPGTWGVSSLTTSGPVFEGYGLTVSSIYAGAAQDGSDRLELEVGAKLDIVEDKLWISGKFAFYGAPYVNPEGYDKWGYDGFQIKRFCLGSDFGSKLRLAGCVEWYDEKIENGINWGNGFRGALSGELMGIGIDVVGQFGRVDENKYFFIDILGDLPGEGVAVAGMVNLQKIGGGFVYGMSPDYTNIVQPGSAVTYTGEGATELYMGTPLGTSMTGVQYVPTGLSNKEIKLMCTFNVVKNSLLNGSGELIFRFGPEWSFDEIELRAQVQLLKSMKESEDVLDPDTELADDKVGADEDPTVNVTPVEDLGLPTATKYSSPFKGFLSLRYNFPDNELHGQVAAFLDAGSVYGAGSKKELCFIDLFYGGTKNWYLWAGEPANRAGATIDLKALKVELSSYFDIGTKVPAFPGLPENVRHLGRDMRFNEAIRSNGSGFAFGASLDVTAGGTAWGTGAELKMGLGFDVMMKEMNNVKCKIIDEDGNVEIKDDFGVRNWYALGQAWAYLTGEVSIVGFNILEAGAAAVLQLQAPNPTWGFAALELSYSVMGGWKEGTWEGEAEFGDRCVFIPENGAALDPSDLFGMDIVNTLNPFDGEEYVALDGKMKANFVIDINESLEDYEVANHGTKTITFELDEDLTGIFDESGNKIDAELIYKEYNFKNLTLKPNTFLPPNANLEVRIAIDVIFDNAVFFTEVKISQFTTEDEFYVIPESNVLSAYPMDGMSNFYKSEYARNVGFIQLDRLQPALFYVEDEYDDEGNIKYYDLRARFTSNGVVHLDTKVEFDVLNNRVEFAIPPTELVNSTIYRLQLVKTFTTSSPNQNIPLNGLENVNASAPAQDDRIIYTSYFRTSYYNTVQEKLDALVFNYVKPNEGTAEIQVGPGGYGGYLAHMNLTYPQETFDAYELYGTYIGFQKPSNALFQLQGFGNDASLTDNMWFRATKDNDFYLMNGALYTGCNTFIEDGEQITQCGAGISKTSVDDRLKITEAVYTSNSFSVESGNMVMSYLLSVDRYAPGTTSQDLPAFWTYRLPDGEPTNQGFYHSGAFKMEEITIGVSSIINDVRETILTILNID